jgi:hypothetical protein
MPTLHNMTKEEFLTHGPFYGCVKSLTHRLKKAGFTFDKVDDGGDELTDVSEMSTQQIAGGICGVDDARLYCTDPSGNKVWLFIVLGNDFCELVCDYSCNEILDTLTSEFSDYWEGKKVVYPREVGAHLHYGNDRCKKEYAAKNADFLAGRY